MFKQYKHEVFLSFTGADREIKTQIREFLDENFKGKSEYEEPCYDSDLYCCGRFREDYIQALDQSRVYLLILSDNLNNDPNKTGNGWLTEVRKEVSNALELEARGELNIVILCLSEFFKFKNGFHDYHDTMGWFFYSNTRGYSQIGAHFNEDGSLSSDTLSDILNACNRFIRARAEGSPMPSVAPKVDIAEVRYTNEVAIKGRDDDVQKAIDAFGRGNQVVVLTGMGGIGKTTLAKEIAKRCDELDYLRCPQIVHIQELGGKNSGLNALVSSVKYCDRVYETLASLSEKDKIDKKIASLAQLPETVLLVIDNYNNLTESNIREILSRLKCRILITTRARVKRDSGVEVIQVDRLNEQSAYEMFCDIVGKKIDNSIFSSIYNLVGGHTITLCIMAKMLLVHKMDAEQLLSEIGELDGFDAKVDFEHNEYGDPDTVLGHLKKLFNINDFDDRCKRVLRSLCILSDGTIEEKTLREVLGLSNRNEIEELASKGWIEIQTKTESDEEKEFIYIHPIVSRLMAQLLTPDTSSVHEMIDYLLEKVRQARIGMTYEDAVVLEETLYYACYVIASSEGVLVKPLWDEYVQINHHLKDAENTNKNVYALSAKLSDNEKGEVIAYGDMTILEQDPTKTEELEKYLEVLEQNAINYKFVLRALSVMMPHLSGNDKNKELLKRALGEAFKEAKRRRDDVAVLALTPYMLYIDGDNAKEISAYTKLQKRETGTQNGALLFMDYMSLGTKIYGSGEGMVDRANTDIAKFVKNPILRALRYMFLSPLTIIKGYKLWNAVDKLSEDDVFGRIFENIYAFTQGILDEGSIDIRSYIDALIDMHGILENAGVTLASIGDVIMRALPNVRDIMEKAKLHEKSSTRSTQADEVLKLKRNVYTLQDEVDEKSPTIRDIAKLQVAIAVSRAFEDGDQAIKASKQMLTALQQVRPVGHVDVYNAMLTYVDLCATYGRGKYAVDYLRSMYDVMQKNGEDSERLTSIAYRILHNSESAKKFNLSELQALFSRIYYDDSIEQYKKHEALGDYSIRVLDMYYYRPRDEREKLVSDIEMLYSEATKNVSKRDMSAQHSLIAALLAYAAHCLNKHLYTSAENVVELLGGLASRSGNIGVRARIVASYVRTILKFVQVNKDLVKDARDTIALCLKSKGYYSYAKLCARYILQSRAFDDADTLVNSAIKSQKVKEKILMEIEALKALYPPRLEGIEASEWEKSTQADILKRIRDSIYALEKDRSLSDRNIRRNIKSVDRLIEVAFGVAIADVKAKFK